MKYWFSSVATFGSIFDLHPTHIKKLYVVDSGLTFNSPYPVVLRPQREVDIILSFDFSARQSDDTPPFKVKNNTLISIAPYQDMSGKGFSLYVALFIYYV